MRSSAIPPRRIGLAYEAAAIPALIARHSSYMTLTTSCRWPAPATVNVLAGLFKPRAGAPVPEMKRGAAPGIPAAAPWKTTATRQSGQPPSKIQPSSRMNQSEVRSRYSFMFTNSQ